MLPSVICAINVILVISHYVTLRHMCYQCYISQLTLCYLASYVQLMLYKSSHIMSPSAAAEMQYSDSEAMQPGMHLPTLSKFRSV